MRRLRLALFRERDITEISMGMCSSKAKNFALRRMGVRAGDVAVEVCGGEVCGDSKCRRDVEVRRREVRRSAPRRSDFEEATAAATREAVAARAAGLSNWEWRRF